MPGRTAPTPGARQAGGGRRWHALCASSGMLLGRVLYRAGVGIAQHPIAWASGVAIVLLMAGYMALATHHLVWAPAADAQGIARGDCADITMEAATSGRPDLAKQAYGCLSPTITSQTSETSFVQRVEAAAQGASGHLTRVGDYTSPDGSKVVFYALRQGNSSVGYVVYLDRSGKVWRLE